MVNRWKNAFVNLGRWLTAWVSMVTAVPAGFLLSITFVGDVVGKLVEWAAVVVEFILNLIAKLTDAGTVDITDGAPLIAWVAVGLIIFLDLISDLTPNRWAVYGAMIWPSLPNKWGGDWGKAINSWSNDLNKWVQETIGEKFGESAAFTAAGLLVTISVVAARKVLPAKSQGPTPVAPSGTSSSSSSADVVAAGTSVGTATQRSNRPPVRAGRRQR
jgi:hypothetical protein